MATRKTSKIVKPGALDRLVTGADPEIEEQLPGQVSIDEIEQQQPEQPTADQVTVTGSSSSSGKAKAAKKVFSFRAHVAEAQTWRIYAEAAGMKLEELGAAAFREYLANHKLTADQQQLYDLMMSMADKK